MSVPDNPEKILERDPVPIKLLLIESITQILAIVFVGIGIAANVTTLIPTGVASYSGAIAMTGISLYTVSVLLHLHRKMDNETSTSLKVKSLVGVCLLIQVTHLGRMLLFEAEVHALLILPLTIAVVFVLSMRYGNGQTTTQYN